MQKIFSQYLRERRAESARMLLDKAYQANKLAKVCSGRSRAVLYDLKHHLLSQGVKLSEGEVFCDSVINGPFPLIGVTTTVGYSFHVPASQLSEEARRLLQMANRRTVDGEAA